MKIGNCIVPSFRLRYFVEKLPGIYISFKDREFNRGELAKCMELEVKSGGFNQKLADLKNYGLINGYGTKYVITDLGKQIAQSNDKSLHEKSMRHVPLWGYLLNKYRDNINLQSFNIELKTKADMIDEQIQSKGQVFFREYQLDLNYINTAPLDFEPAKTFVPEPQMGTKLSVSSNKGIPSGNLPKPTMMQSRGYRLTSDYVQIEIRDELTFNLAMELMKAIRMELLNKENVSATEKAGNEEVRQM